MCHGSRKLVVLGIPWDVDSDELREYMSQFGDLVEAVVMKDRVSGRSRGFGYVTFSSSEDAEKVLGAQHTLKGRTLDVKVATPKEEMVPASKKSTRIFVARIPLSVTEEDFHSYFMKYGSVIDAYMPKDPVTRQHRGIGFVTYENSESVDKLMSESHELGGSTVAVDRATPKLSGHFVKKPYTYNMPHSFGYSNTNNYSRMEGAEPQANKLLSSVDYANPDDVGFGRTVGFADTSSSNVQAAVAASGRVEKKMFVGRIPVEATSEDLHAYFSQFGFVLDVYLPNDAKKVSHRGFGFVTFADEAAAGRVARLRHYLFGREPLQVCGLLRRSIRYICADDSVIQAIDLTGSAMLSGCPLYRPHYEIAVESASPTDRMLSGVQFPANASSFSGHEQDLPSGISCVGTENFTPMTLSTTSKWGKKIFVGRIPIYATASDVRLHFSQFGHVLDVYLPKDETKRSHRGFGFVTFADGASAEYASQRSHRILGQKIVLDVAAPVENEGLNTVPSLSVANGNPLGGSVPAAHSISTQQAFEARIIQSEDTMTNRTLRIATRYRPY